MSTPSRNLQRTDLMGFNWSSNSSTNADIRPRTSIIIYKQSTCAFLWLVIHRPFVQVLHQPSWLLKEEHLLLLFILVLEDDDDNIFCILYAAEIDLEDILICESRTDGLDGQVSAIVLWNGSYSLSIDFPYSGYDSVTSRRIVVGEQQ